MEDRTFYYLIDLPTKSYSKKPEVRKITPHSPIEVRKYIEQFARYFLREMHFGGVQFEAAEGPNSIGYRPYVAYLLGAEDRYIGGACFRFRDDQSLDHPWILDWVWLHPYFRRRGHLLLAWPEITQAHGAFRIAKPISHAMEGFLASVKYEAP